MCARECLLDRRTERIVASDCVWGIVSWIVDVGHMPSENLSISLVHVSGCIVDQTHDVTTNHDIADTFAHAQTRGVVFHGRFANFIHAYES